MITPPPDKRPTVSLVLGSGGARGLAHIGVIEVLIERGYRIRSVAGSSMGALVGGMHAAGRLQHYREWARALQKLDVLRLVDWTIGGGGFIKGERVIAALRELVGELNIEDLSVAYTAVATDLDRQSEVWLSRGPLFDAIRASIAIPGLLRPQVINGRTLVDGGLLNPLPIGPTLRDFTDLTIAVNVNAPEDPDLLLARAKPLAEPSGYMQKVAQLFDGLFDKPEVGAAEPGWRDLVVRSLETMQFAITRLKLATHEPDVMINIPRNACAFYEFYRTEELIALGRERAQHALDSKDLAHLPTVPPAPPETRA